MQTYQVFSLRVENMTREDADLLLNAIILNVEAKGLRMGGGFFPQTDADLSTWNQVKGHLRGIRSEILAWWNDRLLDLAERMEGWL